VRQGTKLTRRFHRGLPLRRVAHPEVTGRAGSALPAARILDAAIAAAGHDFVQAAFIGQLINRRKAYPTTLRTTLERNFALRQTADY